MSTLLERLVAWGQQLVDTLGYIGLAVIMFVENVFPPMPSEPFLLGAGFSSAQGGLSLVGSLVAATIGAIVGATFWYGVGLVLPEERIRQLLRRHGRWAMVGEDDLDRALAWFRGHGRLVILFGRCIPIVRSLISVPAGLARMGLARFLLYTAIGTAAWSALLIGVGAVLGENWKQALGFFDRYDTVLLALMAVVVVAFFANRVRRRRAVPAGRHERTRGGDPSRSDFAPGAGRPEVPQGGSRREVPPSGGRHERGRGHDHEQIGY